MALLPILLAASALARGPSLPEAPRYQPASPEEVADVVPWDVAHVQADLIKVLPELLRSVAHDCGVSRVYRDLEGNPAPTSVLFERTDAAAPTVRVTATSSSESGSGISVLKIPFGKAACVNNALGSHGIIFAAPDDDWNVRGACTASAIPAPEFAHRFNFASDEVVSITCVFRPVVE